MDSPSPYHKHSIRIDTLIHLGAGRCTEFAAYQQINPERIILVEGNKDIVEYLKDAYGSNPQVELIHQVVAEAKRQVIFNRFSLSDANSTFEPDALLEYYPGIRQIDQIETEAEDISELINRLSLTTTQNILVVDLPGQEGQLIRRLAEAGVLDQFEQLWVYTNAQSLYQQEADVSETLTWIEGQGYDFTGTDTSMDLERPCYQFYRHPLVLENTKLLQKVQEQAEAAANTEKTLAVTQQSLAEAQKSLSSIKQANEKLKVEKTDLELSKQSLSRQLSKSDEHLKLSNQQLAESEKAVAQIHASLAEAQKELASIRQTNEQLEAEKSELIAANESLIAQLSITRENLDNNRTWFITRKEQAEKGELRINELTAKLAESEQKLVLTQQSLEMAQQSLQAQTATGSQLNHLETKLQELFNAQSEQMQQYTNALGQHVTRTAKNSTQQLEAFVSVQKYLVQDGVPLQLNGDDMQADLALQLTELINQQHYDLIIEFGSGTSTLLLAKAILKQQQDKNQNHHLITRERTVSDSYDLPKRIICFEHDKRECKSFGELLQKEGLDHLVDLVFAPLTEVNHKGSEYLYYESKAKLRQIAQVFENREAKLLILVNGPDTQQEQLDRFPVLPLLLKQLAAHQLDLLLTNAQKNSNPALLQKWDEILEKRCLTFHRKELASQKGALLLSINR
ncbi:hypothetical protein [Nitrincola sp. MINF-07-Sa-05]|uniref:hypothetical protein n=1 Tax=Nitrincola salilacus TaxID=3400273 RepID=UPI003917DD7D